MYIVRETLTRVIPRRSILLKYQILRRQVFREPIGFGSESFWLKLTGIGMNPAPERTTLHSGAVIVVELVDGILTPSRERFSAMIDSPLNRGLCVQVHKVS